MATNYPGSLDAWSNPTSSTTMDATGYEHDLVHSNVYDAIEAIEGELGTSPSGALSTVGQRIATTQVYAGYSDPTYLFSGPRYMTSYLATQSYGVAAQMVVYMRWMAPESFTATKLWWIQVGAASGVTSASVGIFDSSGTLLASASSASVITSTGLKSVTISSTSVTAGTVYYLALTVDATTVGNVAATSMTQNAVAVTGASSSDRICYAQFSQASMPSSVTFSGLSTSTAMVCLGIST